MLKVTVLRLLAIFVFSSTCLGQVCTNVASASFSQIVQYLKESGSKDPICVQSAFHQIAVSGESDALVTVASFLNYKRPLTDPEKYGIYMHGPTPDNLYPAVHELALAKMEGETAIFQYIAHGENFDQTGLHNALWALLSIHQGDIVEILSRLHNREVLAPEASSRERFSLAVKDGLKFCNPAEVKNACETVLGRK